MNPIPPGGTPWLPIPLGGILAVLLLVVALLVIFRMALREIGDRDRVDIIMTNYPQEYIARLAGQ